MAVSDRWNRTGAVKDPNNVTWVSDGAGGRTGTPSVVVASWTYMRWNPTPFKEQAVRTLYGVVKNPLWNFQGEYDTSIANGHVVEESTTGLRFRVYGVRQHRGGADGSTGSHVSGVMEQLEATT